MGVKLTPPPQEKPPSKSPALLGLKKKKKRKLNQNKRIKGVFSTISTLKLVTALKPSKNRILEIVPLKLNDYS